ncbi:arylsulfatase I-like [Babylonia areolata]|uniref:arylsulfatase I-like n=1 Tax=Babylonia areolata TaxID=304850 RepID=UPI003FD6A879
MRQQYHLVPSGGIFDWTAPTMTMTRVGPTTTLSSVTTIPLLLLLLLVTPTPTQANCQPPHIVVVMADDLGWGDVGYRDHDMYSPNINRLAEEGVLLDQSYMHSKCTPSRAAFLTGIYPFKMGLQHNVLYAGANESMPLDKRVFAQDLQERGYSTYYVGKWHLGHCRPEMTPTYRGFNTFYGMYTGRADHYTHDFRNGYDLHDDVGQGPTRNFTADFSVNGSYSTEIFTDRAVDIIQKHDESKPLFLLLSYQAMHVPFQVPEHYITDYCANVTNGGAARRTLCGMMAAMDEGIGKVMTALEQRGFDDNLLTMFISDNGGPAKDDEGDFSGASNYPLRGYKVTPWEGGHRVPTILHSKTLLPDAPYTWKGFMHATDWYPTLMQVAGFSVNESNMDGMDNWERIVNNSDSRRTEFIYTINEIWNNSALRWHNYKLITAKQPYPEWWSLPPVGQPNITGPRGNYPDYMLFDLDKDPSELNDLSGDPSYECLLSFLKCKLNSYAEGLVPTRPKQYSGGPKIDPEGGYWLSGWC